MLEATQFLGSALTFANSAQERLNSLINAKPSTLGYSTIQKQTVERYKSHQSFIDTFFLNLAQIPWYIRLGISCAAIGLALSIGFICQGLIIAAVFGVLIGGIIITSELIIQNHWQCWQQKLEGFADDIEKIDQSRANEFQVLADIEKDLKALLISLTEKEIDYAELVKTHTELVDRLKEVVITKTKAANDILVAKDALLKKVSELENTIELSNKALKSMPSPTTIGIFNQTAKQNHADKPQTQPFFTQQTQKTDEIDALIQRICCSKGH